MAYRPFLGAPFLECWSDGKYLHVQEPNGSVTSYRCPIGQETDRQYNPFIGPDAKWVLYVGETLFVGRNDCTFSGFDKSGLLVRYGGWDYRNIIEFEPVGQMNGQPAFLDPRDLRTIYIQNYPYAFVLKESLHGTVEMSDILRNIYLQTSGLTLSVDKGDESDAAFGTWIDPSERLGRNSLLQL